jgi:hypothetical protein
MPSLYEMDGYSDGQTHRTGQRQLLCRRSRSGSCRVGKNSTARSPDRKQFRLMFRFVCTEYRCEVTLAADRQLSFSASKDLGPGKWLSETFSNSPIPGRLACNCGLQAALNTLGRNPRCIVPTIKTLLQIVEAERLLIDPTGVTVKSPSSCGVHSLTILIE